MSFLSKEKLNELKAFVTACKNNPSLLHHPDLTFFKEYLESLGARVPAATSNKSSPSAASAAPPPAADDLPELMDDDRPEQAEEVESEEEQEEEVIEEEKEEEDTELMTPDTLGDQVMGDESKMVSEEERDESTALKIQAVEAQNEGDLEKAMELFTKSVQLNPQSGLTYASRAACYLALKKPNAAIRDCDIAIKGNPDSAKAYKVRGKAYRFLGKYEEALKDIQLGNKLDFDDSSYELQKFLTARVAKRKEIEAKRKEREAKKAAARKDAKAKKSASGSFGGMPGGFGGMPGGFGGMPGGGPDISSLLSDPDIQAAFSNPNVMAKLTAVMRDPSQAEKYKDDPDIAKIINKLQNISAH